MGKTIRGFNGQPSEPDYPLPADLPFSVEPTQDNGARAAERLELAARLHGQWDGDCYDRHDWQDCRSRTWWEGKAAAILANGAAFLPDAAELDRLRGIEFDAKGFATVVVQRDAAEDQVLRQVAELSRLRRIEAAARALNSRPDRAVTDARALDALRAALAPEGSARDGG